APMRVLAIETSTAGGGVAAGEADPAGAVGSLAPPVVRLMEADHRHVETLLALAQEALVAAGWRPADIELMAVDEGPGSYTSLRVGVAAAKTLAYALGVPLVGIRSLDLLSEAARAVSEFAAVPPRATLVPVIEASPGKVFWTIPAAPIPERPAADRNREGEVGVGSPAECADAARRLPNALLFGGGAVKHRATLEAAGARVHAGFPTAPAPALLVAAGAARFAAAGGCPVHGFRPFYLLPPAVTVAGRRLDAPDLPITMPTP
ncbi:MAG: tRNA (adenosine(37)-N6)-threonylcarbamoyltransferase complex dimerization subunit type 1 TsaB, partial [Planctomycetes bacterium]|nr:tRNA (adenosine(37)-N6)-threonylcarbamoyltransferase complex dimerization subunit type 1 TsaB [Planctomycetota bacterium]